ncbi:uncharacterized protein A4U43_C03F16590 [Asparagus officinalis]|uniref:Uncharacterized protein n=1 Tax=Asparagus officinalis TaxID=4686 RepID=A0A5P1FCD1_ASPOF|nr:uncharacterized protein A4U43_C03F16590 [Asparagus officinalis]
MRRDDISASAASSSATTTTSDGLELDMDSPLFVGDISVSGLELSDDDDDDGERRPRAGQGFTSICWGSQRQRPRAQRQRRGGEGWRLDRARRWRELDCRRLQPGEWGCWWSTVIGVEESESFRSKLCHHSCYHRRLTLAPFSCYYSSSEIDGFAGDDLTGS